MPGMEKKATIRRTAVREAAGPLQSGDPTEGPSLATSLGHHGTMLLRGLGGPQWSNSRGKFFAVASEMFFAASWFFYSNIDRYHLPSHHCFFFC